MGLLDENETSLLEQTLLGELPEFGGCLLLQLKTVFLEEILQIQNVFLFYIILIYDQLLAKCHFHMSDGLWRGFLGIIFLRHFLLLFSGYIYLLGKRSLVAKRVFNEFLDKKIISFTLDLLIFRLGNDCLIFYCFFFCNKI